MNCDRIAPFYRIFETAAFGRRLQKHRLVYLTAAAEKRRALILGDGDGRFTEVLTRAYPNLQIDSLELSAGMIAEARKRLTEKGMVPRDMIDVQGFLWLGTGGGDGV